MIAKADRSNAKRIAGRLHFAALSQRFLIRRAQTPDRKIDPFARNLPVCRSIAFAQHQFARQAQQRVGQARAGAVRIVPEADQRTESRAARAAQFQRIEPEA